MLLELAVRDITLCPSNIVEIINFGKHISMNTNPGIQDVSIRILICYFS